MVSLILMELNSTKRKFSWLVHTNCYFQKTCMIDWNLQLSSICKLISILLPCLWCLKFVTWKCFGNCTVIKVTKFQVWASANRTITHRVSYITITAGCVFEKAHYRWWFASSVSFHLCNKQLEFRDCLVSNPFACWVDILTKYDGWCTQNLYSVLVMLGFDSAVTWGLI